MDFNEARSLEISPNIEAELEEDSAMNFDVRPSLGVNCNSNNNSQRVSDNSEKEKCEARSTKNDEAETEESCEILVVPENKSASSADDKKLSAAQVIISKPLCADYRSDIESVDSESDSSDSVTDTTSVDYDGCSDSSDSGKNKKKSKEKERPKTDSYNDLPLIEDLKISVPEDECVEIGIITSIVDLLVVVESFKGSAALDVDTVLFLDNGRRPLGKVFDILGPITEPVYTIRFNSEEHIKSLNIEKNSKVYYAPKTQYTNFVFMSEVLKVRGSDASWKDNIEAPPEFQDFSDDEEERRFKHKQTKEPDETNTNMKDQIKPKKRCFKTKKFDMLSPGKASEGFFNSQPSKRSLDQRTSSVNPFSAPWAQRPSQFFHPPFFPLYPPNYYYPLRFSRPSFSGPRGFTIVNQPPVYQQTTQGYHHRFEPWGRAMFRHFVPPPPPPPPTEQKHQQPPICHPRSEGGYHSGFCNNGDESSFTR